MKVNNKEIYRESEIDRQTDREIERERRTVGKSEINRDRDRQTDT
jgi:hypothetical protein